MFRCVQVVRRLLAKNREIGLFCNLSASTLVDAETFPQFSEFMEANKAIAPALVFEFTQSALRAMGPIENESLVALRERGYRFSLDNVTDLRIEPRDLAERGFACQGSPACCSAAPRSRHIHPPDFAGCCRATASADRRPDQATPRCRPADTTETSWGFGSAAPASPPGVMQASG